MTDVASNTTPTVPPGDQSSPGEKIDTSKGLSASDKIKQNNQAKKNGSTPETPKPETTPVPTSTVTTTIAGVPDVAKEATNWLSRQPTPGGLMLLFIIVVAITWLIIPVNGHTRFELLLMTLFGKTSLNTGGSSQTSNTTSTTQQTTQPANTAASQSAVPAATFNVDGYSIYDILNV